MSLPWRPIETALRDGIAFLAYGQHERDEPQMWFEDGRHVTAGDHWFGIILWDKWRPAPDGQRWVYAKTGEPTPSEPTHWLRLEPPAEQPGRAPMHAHDPPK